MATTETMANAIGGATAVWCWLQRMTAATLSYARSSSCCIALQAMSYANNMMNMPQIQSTMAEFQRQSEMMSMNDEYVTAATRCALYDMRRLTKRLAANRMLDEMFDDEDADEGTSNGRIGAAMRCKLLTRCMDAPYRDLRHSLASVGGDWPRHCIAGSCTGQRRRRCLYNRSLAQSVSLPFHWCMKQLKAAPTRAPPTATATAASEEPDVSDAELSRLIAQLST